MEAAPRLLALLLLLGCSAFFSGSEISLFSLPRGRRERMARSERKSERLAASLLANPPRLIITLLAGNELVNIAFTSLTGGLVERLAPGWGQVALVLLASAVTVPLILVFGEIIPKSIAIRMPERWARVAARVIHPFSVLITPIRLVFLAVSAGFLRVLGVRPGLSAPRDPIGEGEFKALVDAGSAEGTLEAAERRLIHRVFEFGERRVAEIMTPAQKVFALSYKLPLARLTEEIARRSYSRVPIYGNRKDEIVGILYAKDLVALAAGRVKGKTVKELLRTPFFVPKTTKCERLFRDFKRTRTHMAVIVDEYGRLAGLITMEDLLEELFGEIRDEKEPPPAPPGETRRVPRLTTEGEAS